MNCNLTPFFLPPPHPPHCCISSNLFLKIYGSICPMDHYGCPLLKKCVFLDQCLVGTFAISSHFKILYSVNFSCFRLVSMACLCVSSLIIYCFEISAKRRGTLHAPNFYVYILAVWSPQDLHCFSYICHLC